MSYFVFSAILSIIILASIVFVAPLSDYLLRRVDKTAQGSLGHVVLRIAFGFIIISILLALIAYIAGVLHPSTVTENPIISSVSSQPFRQVILGFLFAVLFIVWLIESRRDQTKSDGGSTAVVPATVVDVERDFIAVVGRAFGDRDKPSAPSDPVSSRLWVTLLGYLLVALFIVGSLDVFNVIAQKIESFKAGPEGVEFSFKEAATHDKKAPALALQSTNEIGRSDTRNGVLSGSPPAIDLLTDLGRMMERDNRYIEIVARSTNSPVSSKVTPSLIQFAKDYIYPLSSCSRSLWLVSGSSRLAQQSFGKLDEPAQELAHALQFGATDKTGVIENLARPYSDAAKRAIKEAYVDYLNRKLADQLNRKLVQSLSEVKESHLAGRGLSR
jgi:hypothetical protein